MAPTNVVPFQAYLTWPRITQPLGHKAKARNFKSCESGERPNGAAMGTRRITLTRSLADKILGGIRAGAYPFVAAEAFGVPKRLFDKWLSQANQASRRPRFRWFANRAREAAAVARLLIETAIYKEDPKTWLIHGPGRETGERPGWSVSVKPADETAEFTNALCVPEIMRLLNKIIETVQRFPEARDAVTKMVNDFQWTSNPEKHHGTASICIET
jgi:hypothetical protein